MCGSEAVPSIMHAASVTNRQASSAPAPGVEWATVSARTPAGVSVGFSTPT